MSDEQRDEELAELLALPASELAEVLGDGELSPRLIEQLPPQSLYLALQTLGLDAALSVIDELPRGKYKIVLDFELWQRDSFNEERFWEWLAMLDEQPSLASTEHFLRALDISLLGVLTSRYVRVVYSEEQTDPPPGPGYFTPDRGNTWIAFVVEDGKRHRLLAKLFALLFEVERELFYQVILSGTSGTPSEFEEEAYQEKSARLSAVGIPTDELSARLNTPLPKELVADALRKASAQSPAVDLGLAITPLIRDGSGFQPLMRLLNELYRDELQREQVESELTQISNAALVFYRVDFSNQADVFFQVEKIKGAINLGLQAAVKLSGLEPKEIYSFLKIEKLYRFGLQLLRDVQKVARSVPEDIRDKAGAEDGALRAILQAVLEDFPVLPAFFDAAGADDRQAVLNGDKKVFSQLEDLEAVESLLKTRFHH